MYDLILQIAGVDLPLEFYFIGVLISWAFSFILVMLIFKVVISLFVPGRRW